MQFLSTQYQNIGLFLVVILSLILGSFTSFITYRLGNKTSIFAARSICPNCSYKLHFFNLVPLFSYLLQKGKCSNCKCKISLRYPAIEVSFLLSFLLIYFALGKEINVAMLLYFAITTILFAMIIIDLEHYFIPNSLQYFLAFLVAIFLFNQGGFAAISTNIKSLFIYGFSGIALWAFFYFTARLDAIGIDDIKFFFVAGLFLGEKNFLSFMVLSGIFGVVFGGLWQKFKEDETFPFAPAICASFFAIMLFGKKIDAVEIFGKLIGL